MKRRAEFSQFLSYNASLTVNRYFRLMSLATVELLFNLPLSSYGLYLNATGRPIYKWVSWSNTHFDWYSIDTFPAIVWRASRVTVINIELSRWSLVFCALLFFAFFGFAEEAKKNYRRSFWAVMKKLGISPPPSTASAASKALSGYVYFRVLCRPRSQTIFTVSSLPNPHLRGARLLHALCSSNPQNASLFLLRRRNRLHTRRAITRRSPSIARLSIMSPKWTLRQIVSLII